jgi:hypothetical protein
MNVIETALSDGPNWVGVPCPIHLRTETDPVSESLWSFVKLSRTRRWTEPKRSQIVLYNIHHRQNPFKSIHFSDAERVCFWDAGTYEADPTAPCSMLLCNEGCRHSDINERPLILQLLCSFLSSITFGKDPNCQLDIPLWFFLLYFYLN